MAENRFRSVVADEMGLSTTPSYAQRILVWVSDGVPVDDSRVSTRSFATSCVVRAERHGRPCSRCPGWCLQARFFSKGLFSLHSTAKPNLQGLSEE